jgi:hypothetical protein
MSDLLEFLLNLVVDILSCGAENWAGWRFFLCFFGSLAVAMLIDFFVSSSGAQAVLSAVVTFLGAAGGFIWEMRSNAG